MAYQWRFYNNGLSFEHVAPEYEAITGDVLYPAGAAPDATRLATDFPGYTAAAAEASAKTAFAAASAAGVQITSASTPGIDGTYGISPQDEINITGLQAGIAAGALWFGGYRDQAGVKHTMTAAQFTALATAILGYIEALDEALAASLGGAPWSAPAQPAPLA